MLHDTNCRTNYLSDRLTTTHHETQGHPMSKTSKITQKMRERRKQRAFERVLDSASPSVRAELTAIAQRQNFIN
jgi:hypothetical protein